MTPTSRVAYRHLRRVYGADLQDVLLGLRQLGELDENLTNVLDTFNFNYRLASFDTEVRSHTQALNQARSGLAHAMELVKTSSELVRIYPGEKMVLRAAKDAELMVLRFQKNHQEAARMIRILSKKAMPPDLAKAAKSFESSLRRILVDPKLLDVIHWQEEDQNWKTKVKGAVFQVVFRILKQPGMKVDQMAQIKLYQSLAYQNGVEFQGWTNGQSGESVRLPYSPQAAMDLMLKQLKGWSGAFP